MRRRTTAVLLVLLVAGCGQAARPYTPRSAPSATATESAESARPSAPGVETVEVGGGKLRVDIDWPAERDPLMRVITDWYLASRKVMVSGSDRYLNGLDLELDAARQAYDGVRRYTEEDRRVKGVARLYDLRVTKVLEKGAQIDTCVDESKVRVVTARTGEAVSPQPSIMRAPYLQRALAHRGDDGVWRIRELLYDKEGCAR
ncbi:hypothetical protein [Nonomuraea sp. WAC 01424]|uniref:hypothetical protein n=1 Tax=Nonomuraea sp. WAC 01424 TaxID=2203200 RepID=UPI000F79EC80|nr:hypothetical protein [Nonomuraea sp. WAC 01424]